MKTAVVFGVTGQDGSYLSELLLEEEYRVIGVQRRVSVDTTERLYGCKKDICLIEGDITDPSSVSGIINEYKPDECYNLSAQSHVATSFEQPTLTFQVNAVGVLNILEAIRLYSPKTRFYQASTSEMFGGNFQKKLFNKGYCAIQEWMSCQDEKTILSPNSPYAVAKVAAHHLVDNYRRAYNIHASAGILFNHESPRRGDNFVTKKITKWIGQFYKWKNAIDSQLHDNMSDLNYILKKSPVSLGGDGLISDKFPKLRLGNLDACRDWGHAKDYVRAMWLMLQQDKPDDYVIATGKTYSVRDFLSVAFQEIGIENWSDYVVIDPKFYRPCEVEYLLGDASKAKRVLGWQPEITFEQLVKEMVQYDINAEKTT
jgi:GDPmannose 4,6-dehydratase